MKKLTAMILGLVILAMMGLGGCSENIASPNEGVLDITEVSPSAAEELPSVEEESPSPEEESPSPEEEPPLVEVESPSAESEEDTPIIKVESEIVPSPTDTGKQTSDISATTYEELERVISTDVDTTMSTLEEAYLSLSTEINTLELYINNYDSIEEFYNYVISETEALWLRLYDYSISYVNLIISSGKDFNDMYDDADNIYDEIYDDAGDDIYSDIYDGILEEMYRYYYDGILDDKPESMEYSDWSDLRSDEYEIWSDTRSDVYDTYSDSRSDIYDFVSDIRSALWDDDLEEVNKELADFKETLEKARK
jgi:hypothetical protein